MWLFTLFASYLLFGAAVAEGEHFNHAAAYAANIISPHGVEHNTQQIGNFVLVNQCSYDVYIWEVYGDHDSGPMKLNRRSAHRVPIIIRYDIPSQHTTCENNCGVAYKVATVPELHPFPNGNQVQFEYSTKDGIMYYDISFVDCAKNLGHRSGDAIDCPGWNFGTQIDGQKSFNCRTMTCPARNMCIGDKEGAYYIDDPLPKWGLDAPIGTCPSYKMEVYFRLCASQPDLP